jgi:fructokinase
MNPPANATMPDPDGLCIGVDLGGTKTEVAVLDRGGAFRLRQRVPTPRTGYADVLATIAQLVADAERVLGLQGLRLPVGVGIPGSPSARNGQVRNANSTVLNGQCIEADLCTRLDREVRVANDANCLALSEATDGAGAGRPVVFAVILGTGIGAGIAIHGQVLPGHNGIAGEWGHNPLPAACDAERDGPACWCGRRGCIEAWLSGPGLSADHARAGGPVLPAETLVVAARAGDAAAGQTLARHADRLARALATVINVLDPDVIVLGGGLSRIASLYHEVPGRWTPHVFSDVVDTALRPARHGDSSGVRGAAWLARPDLAPVLHSSFQPGVRTP